MATSVTDLTDVRKKWLEEKGLDPAKATRPHSDRPIRNHGLFSKAERALEMAGWSESARRDVEIFRLVRDRRPDAAADGSQRVAAVRWYRSSSGKAGPGGRLTQRSGAPRVSPGTLD